VIASAWGRYGAVVLVTVLVLLPLGAVVAVAAARWRTAHGWERSWARRASTAEAAAVVGTLPWLWMILSPSSGEGGIQLVPFHDLDTVLAGGDAVVQVIGNLLVFAALGFFLPVRFRLARRAAAVPGVVALIAAGLSVMCETLQFVLQLGRVSSVDDVLLNAAGAVAACLLSRPWWRARIRTA